MLVFSVPWLTSPGTFAALRTGRIDAKPDELPMPVTSATPSSLMNDLTMPSALATL